jgi:(S)-mandelate dehydrogenase
MRLLNVEEYRKEARRRLPRFVFDYLDGGAEDEIALKANRSAFEAIKMTPRLLNDVSVRDQSVDWFGQRLPMPIVIAPTGLNGLYRRDGDILLAKAASRLGIPFTQSTASNNSIEEVAKASNGDLWFQLYVTNRDFADRLVDRAFAADFSHLVLTVDVAMGGKWERDERNNFVMPFRLRPKTIADILCHPRWRKLLTRFLKVVEHLVEGFNLRLAMGGDLEAARQLDRHVRSPRQV